jgi:hypothetical protein
VSGKGEMREEIETQRQNIDKGNYRHNKENNGRGFG